MEIRGGLFFYDFECFVVGVGFVELVLGSDFYCVNVVFQISGNVDCLDMIGRFGLIGIVNWLRVGGVVMRVVELFKVLGVFIFGFVFSSIMEDIYLFFQCKWIQRYCFVFVIVGLCMLSLYGGFVIDFNLNVGIMIVVLDVNYKLSIIGQIVCGEDVGICKVVDVDWRCFRMVCRRY